MQSIPRAKVPGPLAPFADGFRGELERLGYTPLSREGKVNQMSGLSRWLERNGLVASDVTAVRVKAFLVEFGANRQHTPTLKSMKPLLDWLRAQGVMGADPPVPRREVDDLMDDYRRWMVTNRALAARTVDRYEKTARCFLGRQAEATGGLTGAERLSGQAVTAFLLAEVTRGLGPGSLQGRVAELRSLLRFLYLSGLTDSALAGSVPSVPGWKDTAVPRRLGAAQVRILLDSCDRTTETGIRDFAMLGLLARLGLRAAEVGGIELGDIDWRSGELVIRGKARREDRLPMPTDVGEALVTYLVEARPRVESRSVFLTVAAPPRPMGSTTVSQMVWRQSVRAGLTPLRAHRLRHALATDLLDQGVTLPEIAQVLRHRDLATTAVYAKVDHAALRELALPWPMVAR
jgi:site-specific recombinase XerD